MIKNRSKVVRIMSAMLTEEAVVRLSNFLCNMIIIRSISQESYGYMITALSLMNNFMLVGDFGLKVYGTSETGRLSGEIQRRETEKIFTARSITSMILTFVGILLVIFLPWPLILKQLSILYLVQVTIDGFNPDWYLRGTQKFSTITAIRAITAGVYLITTIVTMYTIPSAMSASVAFVFSTLLTTILLLRKTPLSFSVKALPTIPALLKKTLPISGARILQQVPRYLPPLLLMSLVSPTESALFGGAFKMILLILVVDTLFGHFFLSTFPKYWQDNRPKAQGMINTLYHGALLIGIVCCVILSLLGKPLLMLIFGHNYGTAAPSLTMGSFFILFTLLNSIMLFGLMMIGERKAFFNVTLVGILCSLPLLPLACKIYGAQGAMLSIGITEAAVFVGAFLTFKRHVPLRWIPLLATMLCCILFVSSTLFPLEILKYISYAITFIVVALFIKKLIPALKDFV